MSMSTIQSYQAALPNLHWLIPVVGNWSFSIFYILSELWGSVVLSMLFWQFANEITKVGEAKRFYGLFGMVGNIGLLLSGPVIILTAKGQMRDLFALGTNVAAFMEKPFDPKGLRDKIRELLPEK